MIWVMDSSTWQLGSVPVIQHALKLADAEPVQELCRSCREAVMPLTSAVMDAT